MAKTESPRFVVNSEPPRTSRAAKARDRLLAKYPADEFGVWLIVGEAKNADLCGSQGCADLGYAKGRYKHVVEYALTFNSFFTFGEGGRITKISPVIVSPLGDHPASMI